MIWGWTGGEWHKLVCSFRDPDEIWQSLPLRGRASLGKLTLCKNLWCHIYYVPVGKLFPTADFPWPAWPGDHLSQEVAKAPSFSKVWWLCELCIWRGKNSKYFTDRLEPENPKWIYRSGSKKCKWQFWLFTLRCLNVSHLRPVSTNVLNLPITWVQIVLIST